MPVDEDGDGLDAGPLDLEHMIGFSADHDASVQAHPMEPDTMVMYTGCLVIIASTKDPHKQEFLRGHNEEITCLALSPMGNFLASGQLSSTRVPNSEAFVIVWDFKTRQQIYCLNQLNDGVQFSRNRVLHLQFSPDEHFLAGSDDQTGGTKLCLWDVETGALANISVQQRKLSYLCWGDVVASSRKMSRHDSYKLYAGADNKVHKLSINFDPATMQYKLDKAEFAMPSSGLSRAYHCAEINRTMPENGGDTFMVAGSSAGELCVFNTETLVFRACVPVSCGGLLSLAATLAPEGPLVWCGCGDGYVKLLCGQDKDWKVMQECRLSGSVSALSLNADGTELIAGTMEGDVYVLDSLTLRPCALNRDDLPLMSCHTVPIHCMSFAGANELFLTGAQNGVVRMWDLSHYMVRCHIAVPGAKAACPTCIVYTGDGQIMSGWTDGFIRCHTPAGAVVWEMSQAHRGGVTALALSPTYALSGGADGALRLWSLGSHKLVEQFAEHHGKVSAVVIDNAQPYLIHSCGEDKSVVTVNLKQKRRVVTHTVEEGQFKTMVQTTQGERELLTGDSTGAVKVWDCDQVAPMSMLLTWTAQDEALGKEKRLTHLSLSPPTEDRAGGNLLLAANAAGELQVWDLGQADAPLAIGTAHSDEVSQAGWSPDGRQIVSVGKDCCICVWNFFG